MPFVCRSVCLVNVSSGNDNEEEIIKCVHSSQFAFFSQQTALFLHLQEERGKNPILLNNKNSIFGIVCAFDSQQKKGSRQKYWKILAQTRA